MIMNDSKHFLYISTSKIERHRANLLQTFHTVQGFIRSGMGVQVLMPKPKKRINIKSKLESFNIHENINIHFTSFLNTRYKYFDYTLFLLRYHKFFNQYDHIYTRNPFISLALCKRNIHHGFELHDLKWLYSHQLIDKVISNYNRHIIKAIFCTASLSIDHLIKFGAKPDNLFHTPNGISPDRFQQLSPFNYSYQETPKVGFFGRLRKNTVNFIEKLANTNVCRIIIVGHLPERHNLAQYPNIDIYPPVSYKDLANYFNLIDFIILPYQDTNLQEYNSINPLKLFEGMASGRPVICSDLPSIREVIRHRENGILVSSDDLDGWIDAIQDLKNDSTLAHHLSRQAVIDSRKYSWDNKALHIKHALYDLSFSNDS